MQSTTRIYQFHEYGNPEVLKLDSLPTPQPGLGEVRVLVSAMSLNRADLLWVQNNYVETPELPSKLGYEVCGTNEEAFSRAKKFIAGGLADGSFPVTIDREFQGLETLPDAMNFMASNKAKGKIVVTVS